MQNKQIFAKIWTYLLINVNLTNIQKIEQVAHRGIERPTIPQRYGRVCKMQFCIFSMYMTKTSSYAKSGTEVHTNAAKYVCSQVHIFVYVSVCLLAMVPQSGDQQWLRFLFCLQPAGLAVAAKFSLLLLRSIAFSAE